MSYELLLTGVPESRSRCQSEQDLKGVLSLDELGIIYRGSCQRSGLMACNWNVELMQALPENPIRIPRAEKLEAHL